MKGNHFNLGQGLMKPDKTCKYVKWKDILWLNVILKRKVCNIKQLVLYCKLLRVLHQLLQNALRGQVTTRFQVNHVNTVKET